MLARYDFAVEYRSGISSCMYWSQIAPNVTAAIYSDFILEASRLLSHSMFSNLLDPEKVVGVYSLAARIRLNSSAPVIRAAESVVTQIITQYGEPNLNVEDMRKSVLESRVDWMGDFTSACRKELFEVFKRGGAIA